MRLQPLLQTVLWAVLLSSPLRGGCGLRLAVYWNSSNPRLLQGDAVVELGFKDYLDIICPHYESPGPPEGPETFALYVVDWAGYKACRAEGPGAFKRWECSHPFAPFGPVRFPEKIQRFTPFSLGMEFLPGETYYYISVPTPGSPGQCLRLQVSICCKEDTCGSLRCAVGMASPRAWPSKAFTELVASNGTWEETCKLGLREPESAHPVGSHGESGTSGWQGGATPSPLCLLLLLLFPILRLLRVL